MPEEDGHSLAAGMSWFTTTHWTVVLNAGAEDSSLAAGAIEQLCQTYWQPVHTFIRSRSQRSAEPDDLTQQFFARFLEKQHYRLADRERGRFRAFLLTSVKNFLVNEWERAAAQKRGGGQLPVSLEETIPGEDVPRLQLVDERTAEQSFEQNWALTVLARAREKLMAEYHADGRAERFLHLEQLLPGQETDMTYAQVAELLGVAEGTIKSDIHRLKRRYRELLRDEVAHTVATPGDVDAELRHLLTVVSRPRTV